MYLRVGSKGDLVRKLQSTLKEHGFDPGHIDGMFGDKTRKAVVELQESMKLEADGVVGHITMEALNIKAKHPAPDMGRITRIREILNKRGLRGKVTEAQLLDVLHTMPPKPRLGAPAHADDSHDFATELVTLSGYRKIK